MKREQARRQRRGRLMIVGGVVVVVVLVVAAVVVAGLNHKTKGATTTTASDAVLGQVTSVPAATYDTVGLGSIKDLPPTINGDPLTADGKPRIVYIGAEYCPFCAAERWSLVAALARFGTFSGLGQTESAPEPEVYPNTSTLSFHGATYTSDYVSFSGYEIQDTNHNTLDTPPADDLALLKDYGDKNQSIPFLDLFGRYVVQGSSYSPEILEGMSHTEIAKAMQDPSSTVAKNVDAMANVFSAIICQSTDGQPSDVCSSAGVQAATDKLSAS